MMPDTVLPLHEMNLVDTAPIYLSIALRGCLSMLMQWNEALLQLVVAPAYLDLLTAAAKVLGHGAEYARCEKYLLRYVD